MAQATPKQFKIVWDGTEEARELISNTFFNVIASSSGAMHGGISNSDITVTYYREVVIPQGWGVIFQKGSAPEVVPNPRFTNRVAQREYEKAVKREDARREERAHKTRAVFAAWGITAPM